VVQLAPSESATLARRGARDAARPAARGRRRLDLIVPEALLEQSRRTQRLFNIVMGCIAGISLLVGGIGIMNIMLAHQCSSARARSRAPRGRSQAHRRARCSS
jgi:putative ABC transport system permease protein